MTRTPLTAQPAFKALTHHANIMAHRSMRALFANDAQRGERYVIEAAGLYFDYSKNLINEVTMAILSDLALASGLIEEREAMFRGARINLSESRAALHVALRTPPTEVLEVDSVDVIPQVHATLKKMANCAIELREGRRRGHSGRVIKNVVNVGIGGSELGPVMAYEALRTYATNELTFRFISNIDATDLLENIEDLDPEETLFIVSSKSFTTLETIVNARAAREWIVSHYEDELAVAAHFLAISNNRREVAEFGITPAATFELWDWVGGRYSMGSAIGLSTMIAIGPEHFQEMLSGFRAMDEHFRLAPIGENMPIILGLLTFYYRQFFDAQSIGVMPYERYLKRFPAYLQQLTMESLGKGVTREGRPVIYPTGPVFWGEAGTNGQHSFFQLLHQGTQLVPLDLIGFANSLHPKGEQHEILSANLFAQAEALAFGLSAEEVRGEGTPENIVPFKVMPGNRPTNVILAERLTPAVLGALVALYEHSVFTQSVILQVNPFDQWGVEFGKQLAERILPELEDEQEPLLAHDSSTNSLIRRYRSLRDH